MPMPKRTIFPIPCVCFTCGKSSNCKHMVKVMDLYNKVIGTPYLSLSNIVCAYYTYSPVVQYDNYMKEKD